MTINFLGYTGSMYDRDAIDAFIAKHSQTIVAVGVIPDGYRRSPTVIGESPLIGLTGDSITPKLRLKKVSLRRGKLSADAQVDFIGVDYSWSGCRNVTVNVPLECKPLAPWLTSFMMSSPDCRKICIMVIGGVRNGKLDISVLDRGAWRRHDIAETASERELNDIRIMFRHTGTMSVIDNLASIPGLLECLSGHCSAAGRLKLSSGVSRIDPRDFNRDVDFRQICEGFGVEPYINDFKAEVLGIPSGYRLDTAITNPRMASDEESDALGSLLGGGLEISAARQFDRIPLVDIVCRLESAG